MTIRVYGDSVVISNSGGLPDDLTVEDLHGRNRSHLRNPRLARAIYYAGMIEWWGSGTTRVPQLCRA